MIVADKGKPDYALIATIPTVLFLILDAYYLAFERCFRQSYNSFIEKLHARQVVTADLYAVTPHGSVLKAFGAPILSFSMWPFHVTLAVMIWLTK